MRNFITWFVLGLGILFCGGVSIIQLVLFLGARGPAALALCIVSGILTAGLVVVGVLTLRTGRKFWE